MNQRVKNLQQIIDNANLHTSIGRQQVARACRDLKTYLKIIFKPIYQLMFYVQKITPKKRVFQAEFLSMDDALKHARKLARKAPGVKFRACSYSDQYGIIYEYRK